MSTLVKLRTYDWLSLNPLGNNRPQRRYKDNFRVIMIGRAVYWGIIFLSPFILSWNHINYFATQYCQLFFNHFSKRSHKEREEPNWSPNIWVPGDFHVPGFLHISILTPVVTRISRLRQSRFRIPNVHGMYMILI